jgi:hypothetical protein
LDFLEIFFKKNKLLSIIFKGGNLLLKKLISKHNSKKIYYFSLRALASPSAERYWDSAQKPGF